MGGPPPPTPARPACTHARCRGAPDIRPRRQVRLLSLLGADACGGERVPVERPTDTGDESVAPGVRGFLDTTTGRRSIREQYDFVGTDGLKYRLGYRDFYPLELGKFLGFSYVHVQDGTRTVNRKLKQHEKELKEKTPDPSRVKE